jgi:hypothetical protein
MRRRGSKTEKSEKSIGRIWGFLFSSRAIFLYRLFYFGGGGNRTRVRRHSAKGLYMFIFFLYLVVWLKKKKKTTQPALMLFRYPSSRRTWFAILFIDASQVPQENTRETACLNVRQRLAVVLHLLWSTFLTRWVGPRHATFASLSPSNPVRPQLFSRLKL